MPPPPAVQFPKRRVGRKRRVASNTPPGPPALTLVEATYQEGESVRLTFDRAIDVSAASASAFTVHDGEIMHSNYQGSGLTQIAPNRVEVALTATSPATGTDVELSASNASGIVAADDGAAWAGVTGLVMPFPA